MKPGATQALKVTERYPLVATPGAPSCTVANRVSARMTDEGALQWTCVGLYDVSGKPPQAVEVPVCMMHVTAAEHGANPLQKPLHTHLRHAKQPPHPVCNQRQASAVPWTWKVQQGQEALRGRMQKGKIMGKDLPTFLTDLHEVGLKQIFTPLDVMGVHPNIEGAGDASHNSLLIQNSHQGPTGGGGRLPLGLPDSHHAPSRTGDLQKRFLYQWHHSERLRRARKHPRHPI